MAQLAKTATVSSLTPFWARHRGLGKAILLAVLIGFLAGSVAFFAQPPTYESTALIHIRPMAAPALFVRTQIELLESDHCIDLAMASPMWLEKGRRSNSIITKRAFSHNLHVAADGEIIRVIFRGHDADTSKMGAYAIIDAYRQLTASLGPARTSILSYGTEPQNNDLVKVPLAAGVGGSTFLAALLTAGLFGCGKNR